MQPKIYGLRGFLEHSSSDMGKISEAEQNFVLGGIENLMDNICRCHLILFYI